MVKDTDRAEVEAVVAETEADRYKRELGGLLQSYDALKAHGYHRRSIADRIVSYLGAEEVSK